MTPRQARRERRAAERKAKKDRTGRACQASDQACEALSADMIPAAVAPEITPIEITRTEINRANAQHSTGPRTAEGKLASSRNSLKHGLASAQLIIPSEDAADFEALLAGLLDEHQPASSTEELLVREMAQSWWLTQRALRLQNDCFTENGVDEKRLSLFLRYQTTHERAFHKALNTLIRLKKDRSRGFVSQTRAKTAPEPGFVLQKAAAPLSHLFECEEPHAEPAPERLAS